MQLVSKSYFERVAGILPRRYGINGNRVFLYGAAGCGKSALALMRGARFKKALYVNCLDKRYEIDSLNALILKLYLEKSLECLIVDGYTSAVHLPKIENIILINQNPAFAPEGFALKRIDGLSFEEYISFDKKNISINNLFNLFLKEGNLPCIAFVESSYKITAKQDMLKLNLGQDYDIFCELLLMQGLKLSGLQIYRLLKKELKISKDRLYALLKTLEMSGYIHFVQHIKNANAAKMYFYDFALPMCVSNERNFHAGVENMVLLEIMKFNCGEIFYGDIGEFISKIGVFLVMPFATKEIIESKLQKVLGVHTFIYVITLTLEGGGCVVDGGEFLGRAVKGGGAESGGYVELEAGGCILSGAESGGLESGVDSKHTKTKLSYKAISFVNFALDFVPDSHIV